MPSRVRHDTRELDVGFFEQSLQPVVELHAVARDLVLAAHHGPPEPLLGVGHKTKVSSCATKRFTRRSASGKSLLAPAGAPIRLRVCKVQRAGDRARIGSRPALSVSRTAPTPPRPVANTARSTPSRLPRPRARPASQQARAIGRGWSRPSAVQSGTSPSTSTSATATANIFLCTSIPAIWYGIGLSSWERRACLVASLRVASYRRAQNAATLNYSVNHARSGSNSCSASMAPWLISTSPLPAPTFCPTDDFHVLSRASRPSCNQLRKSSQTPSHSLASQLVRGCEADSGFERLASLIALGTNPCLATLQVLVPGFEFCRSHYCAGAA